ncbi:MAG: nuclear transport factor 2 family protein [Urechidicola sp.]|nr:nuclear transport factor 2 family protein [Urechidicola sp.]
MKKLFLCSLTVLLFVACNNEKASQSDEIKIDNVKIISELYTSFSEGDIDAVLAGFDENIVWNEAENFPYDDGNPYIGPQAVLDGVFARVGGEWDNFIVDERIVYNMDDDMVLVTGRYKGTNKATGKSINAQLVHHWTLKDGKIIQFQQYTDTKQVADAIVE